MAQILKGAPVVAAMNEANAARCAALKEKGIVPTLAVVRVGAREDDTVSYTHLPRPVLMLDDPFSALDRSTEDAIFAELQAYARDKVVFLISHRLYHFPQMQQIIFMEGGRTTVGTHEELMAAVPVYRQLYESQTGLKGGEGA